MPKELDIEGLCLSNAAGLEPQFQEAIRDLLAVRINAEDYETSKGALKFEINAKLKIEMDPRTGETWIDGQLTTKAPKRKTRRQVAQMQGEKLFVRPEPLPEQKLLSFDRPREA